jgi:hypothetical protein
MHPIEKVMRNRSRHFMLVVAVAVLTLVLWTSGSSILSLWLTPVIIAVLWIAIQLGLAYHQRHHAA